MGGNCNSGHEASNHPILKPTWKTTNLVLRKYAKLHGDFQNWINNNLNTNISLTKETILFEKYIDKDYIFNNLLLILKFNIYRSRVKKKKTYLARKNNSHLLPAGTFDVQC